MASIFVAVPSYKGISDGEAQRLCGADALRQAGHTVSVAVLAGLCHLDIARAELQALFIKSGHSHILWQDDDMAVDGPSIAHMFDLYDRRKLDVLLAPYKLRQANAPYGFVPTSIPDSDRLVECLWIALGCVIIRRDLILQLMRSYEDLQFESEIAPGMKACGLFNSIVVDACKYNRDLPEGARFCFGDDRAFSHRLREMGVVAHAYVDAKTNHRGLDGCFGKEIENRAPTGLVGPDGRLL